MLHLLQNTVSKILAGYHTIIFLGISSISVPIYNISSYILYLFRLAALKMKVVKFIIISK